MLENLFPVLSRDGNSRTLAQLDAMAESRALPHGLLIEGDSPAECMELAQIMAKVYMCGCDRVLSGECESCKISDSGEAHPDIVTVLGEGKQNAITVERIRNMRIEAQMSPTKGRSRVFILVDCDTMNMSAQNAFLKLLEEPPENVVFIMLCRQRMNLLETIRSRAVAVRIEGGSSEEAIPDSLRELADTFACAICSQNDWDAVELSAYFIRDKKDNAAVQKKLLQFTGLIRGIIRDAMIISAGAQDILPQISQGAKKLSLVSSDKLEAMLAELDTIDRAVELHITLPLTITAMVSRLKRIKNKK